MSRAKNVFIAIGAGLLLFLTLGAWSLSSPVGASPDEDFHLASIWCGQGEREGLCEPGASDQNRLVPMKAIFLLCFAYSPEVSAACQGPEYLDPGFELGETSRVNISQYPEGFYFWNAFLASDNIAVSTVLMRLANSLLFSVLAVITWTLLPRRLQFTLVGSVALTFVPLGMFLVASINPSGWAIQSGALLLPALIGFFATSGKRRIGLGLVAIIAALMGVGSRGDSAAYVVIAALAAIVLAFQNRRRFYLQAILPVALSFVALFAFLSAGQTGLALEGSLNDEAAGGTPQPRIPLAILNLATLPAFLPGIFGQGWGLGWGDTAMPAAVSVPTFFLFAGVLFTALRTLDYRKSIALLGIALSAIVIPIYILVQAGVVGGFGVQPRYLMPLITMFIAVALAPSVGTHPTRSAATRLSPMQLWIIAIGLSAAQAVALFSNLHRYVTAGSYNLDAEAEWWWRIDLSPFGTLAIGSVTFAILMTLIACYHQRDTQNISASPTTNITAPKVQEQAPSIPQS